MENKRYNAIDGLRTIACIGIVMMHVRNNNTYHINGFAYEKLIPSFVDFVFLFMVISAFGMCCGYLEGMQENKISLESFYKKRYKKILPYFAVLILLDIVITHSKEAVIEGVADLTLLFGLFPNDISVIGVGWFLGLIFAFYFMFPAYSLLLIKKKRAWIAFVIALIMNVICSTYFGVGRKNIVYCMCYFIAGGLIYLYRKELEKFRKSYFWIVLLLIGASGVLYFLIGANTVTILLVSVTMLLYALKDTPGGGVAKQIYEIFQFHQHGSVPRAHGHFPNS